MKFLRKPSLLVAIIGCISPVQGASPGRPPNLIVIMTDDQGYADVGFNGCKDIPTPNLDSIASNGVNFPNGNNIPARGSPDYAWVIERMPYVFK